MHLHKGLNVPVIVLVHKTVEVLQVQFISVGDRDGADNSWGVCADYDADERLGGVGESLEEGERSHETRGPGQQHSSSQDHRRLLVLDAQGKANLFADTFAGKCKLAQPRLNVYTECHRCPESQGSFVFPSEKQCRDALANLGEESSTGRSRLGACTNPQKIRGAVGQTATDPDASSAEDSELARIMARTLDCPHLQEESRFCSRQLQRCPLDGTTVEDARNAHQSHSCFWSKAVRLHERTRCKGRVGLSRDVLDSCAPPTQESCCLLFGRLRGFRQGTGRETFGKFPIQKSSPGLGQSSGVLAAATNRSGGRGGQRSNNMELRSMVFQGTVLGPTLWNLFFEDARHAIQEAGFVEIVYADDLNGFREFEHNVSVDSVMTEAKKCPTELHKWGKANQILLIQRRNAWMSCPTHNHTATHSNCSASPSTASSGWTLCVRETVNQASWQLTQSTGLGTSMKSRGWSKCTNQRCCSSWSIPSRVPRGQHHTGGNRCDPEALPSRVLSHRRRRRAHVL